ncbi:hypothetical protein CLOACE_20380 [Clostridium acetireducens DSM 10703]|uniref:Uncharacterized protein n=1 Tax=Clostridium acetireducens DSM 10703 TaxID=1121290 RepID=A0A1E8EWE5_9CLOT|nr:hypothetical protein [Clostridium acetireducens]OFI04967.1 hypothetical protein CLOACE_20380 [Clostridium acetireducens DSM 10703]
MEKILRNWNNKKKIDNYVYFIDKYDNTLKQLDLSDYSVCSVCDLREIEKVEYSKEYNNILIDLKTENEEDVNYLIINKFGVEC